MGSFRAVAWWRAGGRCWLGGVLVFGRVWASDWVQIHKQQSLSKMLEKQSNMNKKAIILVSVRAEFLFESHIPKKKQLPKERKLIILFYAFSERERVFLVLFMGLREKSCVLERPDRTLALAAAALGDVTLSSSSSEWVTRPNTSAECRFVARLKNAYHLFRRGGEMSH